MANSTRPDDTSDRTARDVTAERAFLTRAQSHARVVIASYPARVRDRLKLGQDLYGDAWATRPVAELLAETVEEATDLAAWASLATQRLQGLEPSDAHAVGEMLARAAGAASEAFALVTAAQRIVERQPQ